MNTLERIRECGVVAVLRGADPETVVETAEALLEGGVTVVEVTADARKPARMIRLLSDTVGDEMVVGAGTVLDAMTAQEVIAAGATFVVSPALNPTVVETCNRYGVLAVPGIMTPTEAVEATEAGADVVKVFPASTVGPDHVAALSGPLPQIDLLPTGGITPENAPDFLAAGAIAVGAGSALVPDAALVEGEFATVTDRAEAFQEAIAETRN